MTPEVLAVLVEDRRRAIAHDAAGARRFRLRRRTAAVILVAAALVVALARAIDDETGTVRA